MKTKTSTSRVLTGYILCAAAIVLIVVLPLVMKNLYSDIDFIKFDVYRWIVIFAYGISGLMAIITVISEKSWKKQWGIFDYKLDTTNYFVVGYLLVVLLSMILSDCKRYCFWGFDGWYMGAFSQISFVIIYVLHRYFDRYKNILFYVLVVTGAVVYLFGILNRLEIDPLNVYMLGTEYEMPNYFRMQFLSTIGQATWYSSYVVVTMSVAIGLYILTEKLWQRIVTGTIICMGFMTLITQNSDSAYMAMAGFITVYFCFSVADKKWFDRFIDVLLLAFISSRLMRILYYIYPNVDVQFDKISRLLIFDNVMWIIVVLGIIGLLYLKLVVIKKHYNKKIIISVRKVYLEVLFVVLGIAGMLLIFDMMGILPKGITDITYKIPYLHWSEFWGSGRGKTWTFSLKMYKDMNIIHQLWGVGPDAYYYEAYGKYAAELGILWPEDIISCAHNEFLNVLICTGALGLLSYAGIFISRVVYKMRKLKDEPMAIIGIAAIVAYVCHNFFCYQQVCSTPFIFMLMA